MKCTLQNLKQKSLAKAGERERLALRTADVWVYNSTMYNAKGTTWSGSPLWKQTRQEVLQHGLIYCYIAAYIQALYMYCPVLLEYTRLVWPPTRGVGRCPQWHAFWLFVNPKEFEILRSPGSGASLLKTGQVYYYCAMRGICLLNRAISPPFLPLY